METDEVDGARSSKSCAYLEHSETELEGEFLGKMCQPCLTEDKNVRSNKFFVECNEYLCKNCIRAHSKFSSTRYHRLAENEESRRTIRSRANAGTCFYHADKYVDHFCEFHDEFCCPLCLNTRQRACKAKTTITEMSSKLTEGEINDVEKKTVTTLAKIQEVKARRTQDLDMLVVQRQEAMNAIESVVSDLKTAFERLHQNHTESLDKKCVKLIKLENDLKTCNEMEGSLKKIERALKCENKVAQFVHMKQLLRKLDVVNATSNAMADDVPEKSIELKRNTICSSILNQPDILVDFEGDLRLYNTKANGKEVKRCVLNKLETTKDCHFTCVYQNPSNSIFQYLDKSISVYDTMTKQMRQIDTAEQISAIAIYNGTFFIALQGKGIVATLDENDKMKTILTTVEPCVGISKSSRRIYVTVTSSRSGQLREYTDTGTLENVLKSNDNGENIFTGGIGEVKICKKEKNIYIADTKNGIVIVSVGVFNVLKIISNVGSPGGISLVDGMSIFILLWNGDVIQTTGEEEAFHYVLKKEPMREVRTSQRPRYHSLCWDECASLYVIYSCGSNLYVMQHQLEFTHRNR